MNFETKMMNENVLSEKGEGLQQASAHCSDPLWMFSLIPCTYVPMYLSVTIKKILN